MGKKISIDKSSNQTQLVGYLRNEIIEQLKLNITNKEIIIYPGAIKHIKERHPYAFKKYFHRLIEMINRPDYIGIAHYDNHKIEFIKTYKDNILIALKIEEDSHIFVSSMYIIEETVVEKRIETGRLYKINLGSLQGEKRNQYKNIKKYKSNS
ncbi:MAG: putative SpbB protein [Clostridia bacterium]|jgi:hypothetical protein|nr:putative SpbB protein [Clostridia bacterium]